MDIVEEAKRELNSGLVAYTEFVLDYKKGSDALYCFYEGKEDRSYYSFRVKAIHPDPLYFDYVCNGKENLLKLYSLINNQIEYRNCNLGYFVDRDFDPSNAVEEIYETPFYSVENFYVVDEAFQNILLNEFNISKQCTCFSLSLELFRKCKDQFHQKVLLLNSWLACQADLRASGNVDTRLKIDKSIKPIIDNDDFDKIVMPDLESVTFPEQFSSHEGIENVFSGAPKIPNDKLLEKMEELSSAKFDEVFRGKFELRFLISFLNRFKEEIGKRKDSKFPKKYSCSLRFEYATSISQLTNNAITPKCLWLYLKNIRDVA